MFSDVSGIAVDRGGRIFVADSRGNEVRVFSPNGTYRFSIGQYGANATKLDDPCCVSFMPDGRLWIAERGKHRYSAFRIGESTGSYDSSVPMPGRLSGQISRITWDSLGRIVHVADSFSVLRNQFSLVRSLVDSTGAILSTHALPVAPAESLAFVLLRSPYGRGTTGVPQPFGPVQLWAFGTNGESAEAVSSHYAISWLDAGDRQIALISRALEGPVVDRRERRHAQQMLVQLAANLGVRNDAIPFGIPDRKAPIKSLGFDIEGRLWVERSVPDDSPHRADLYDRTGQPIERVEWPAAVRLDLGTVRGGMGLGVMEDTLGAIRVVRVRFHG